MIKAFVVDFSSNVDSIDASVVAGAYDIMRHLWLWRYFTTIYVCGKNDVYDMHKDFIEGGHTEH